MSEKELEEVDKFFQKIEKKERRKEKKEKLKKTLTKKCISIRKAFIILFGVMISLIVLKIIYLFERLSRVEKPKNE